MKQPSQEEEEEEQLNQTLAEMKAQEVAELKRYGSTGENGAREVVLRAGQLSQKPFTHQEEEKAAA